MADILIKKIEKDENGLISRFVSNDGRHYTIHQLLNIIDSNKMKGKK